MMKDVDVARLKQAIDDLIAEGKTVLCVITTGGNSNYEVEMCWGTGNRTLVEFYEEKILNALQKGTVDYESRTNELRM